MAKLTRGYFKKNPHLSGFVKWLHLHIVVVEYAHTYTIIWVCINMKITALRLTKLHMHQ